MKKYLLAITICMLSITVTNAQFQIGQKIINGGVTFNTGNNTYYDSLTNNGTNANITLSAGKFITPLHSIGFGITYGFNSNQNGYPHSLTDNKTNSLGFSFFSDYYKPLLKNFYFTFRWNSTAGINFGKSTQQNLESKTTGFNISTSLNPGLSYKISNRFLFNASLTNLIALSYSSSKTTGSNTFNSNNFGFSSSLNGGSLGNVNLGFTYLLKN